MVSMWIGVDPLAEKYPGHSPFNYVLNNPIRLIDPMGMSPEDNEWHHDENGNLVADAKDNVNTLAAYQGITVSEAQKQLDNNGICNVKECDVVNTGSFNLPTVNITASRTNYQSTVDNVADKGDFFSGTTALVPGSFRISTTKQGISPMFY